MMNFILQIFINILAIIGTHFVTKKRERWKFTQEIKQRHLKEVKEQVFLPVIEILKNHWLPILERKRVNLQIETEKIYGENTVTPNLTAIEFILRTYGEPSYLNPVNLYLYKDVTENHYTQILNKYEDFKIDASKYVDKCLSYAKEIRDQILENTNLPEYNPIPSRKIYEEEWIKSSHLAVFIIRKQIVPNDENLTLNKESPLSSSLIVIKDDSYNECALCKIPEKIFAKLDELLNKKDKAYELISLADNLKNDCLSLIKEMEELSFLNELRGSCKYVKF